MKRTLPLALMSAIVLIAEAPDANNRKVTQLAEGVYAIQHKVSNDGTVSGNTTVIIGDRQVLVVDSSFLSSTAREDIAQIRQWTNKPVAYLVNTHFHNDHNNGNKSYLEAFPSLAIIAFLPWSIMSTTNLGRFLNQGSLAFHTPGSATPAAIRCSNAKARGAQ